LRRATRPSLPTSAIMYPRGRSVVRSSLGSDGEVSVTMITSRSARSSNAVSSKSSCWRNRGSLGVSAKTTKGRASHCSSDSVISDPSKTWVRSAFQRSNTLVSWANASPAPQKASAANTNVNLFIPTDIEAACPKAKPLGAKAAKIFAMPSFTQRSVT